MAILPKVIARFDPETCACEPGCKNCTASQLQPLTSAPLRVRCAWSPRAVASCLGRPSLTRVAHSSPVRGRS